MLNPKESVYLYFVADGSGGHAFASTLTEHNRNVARWRDLEGNAATAAAADDEQAASTAAEGSQATTLPEINVGDQGTNAGGDTQEPQGDSAPAATAAETATSEPPASQAPAEALELKPGSVIWASGRQIPIPKLKPAP